MLSNLTAQIKLSRTVFGKTVFITQIRRISAKRKTQFLLKIVKKQFYLQADVTIKTGKDLHLLCGKNANNAGFRSRWYKF
jgi:hypothetical protein